MRSNSSNFQNRASYKGECKRLMSRAHIETVAERAAHFEEIDPERYNRLKSKFYELDQSQQQELLQMHSNMQYPNGAPNSNLILLNNFVESLMMSPNYLINNNSANVASNKLNSKSFPATKTDPNVGTNQPNNATKMNQSSNYSNMNSMNDYLSKVIESKKQPATYDELLGKYEQNINKFYTGKLNSKLISFLFHLFLKITTC